MPYRKVYLTIDEEEGLVALKTKREKEKASGAAFNAIIKQGLRMLLIREGMIVPESYEMENPEPVVVVPVSTPIVRTNRRRRRGLG